MHPSRREFLCTVAASAAVMRASAAEPAAGLLRYDVFIYGATPAGIAAAVAAARLGRKVILAEYEDHVGGIVSNGLTNADIGKKQAVGGLFYEFTRRVVKHYEQIDRDDPARTNLKLCRDGYSYEASAAEQIFHEMLAVSGNPVTLRLRHELKSAEVKDRRLASVVLEDLLRGGERITVEAPIFIDATYEGDLAAMAGVAFRVGREGRREHDEPHAGRIYTHFGNPEPLAGSTGEADDAIQAFCFRFHVTDDPAARLPVEKPAGFNREDYRFTLEQIRAGRITKFTQVIQVYPMPRRRFELNSNHCDPKLGVPAQSLDLAEENFAWPTASPAQRRKMYERYLAHNVGLLWLLQQEDAEIPAAIRAEARRYGWHKDEWPANGHVPRQVYVRQGRRIVGRYLLTEHDGDPDPSMADQRTRLQPESIAVLEFAFDSHACHAYDPAHPGVREGYFYVNHPPLQLPYGVILPRELEGLLVPVACSATHVAYNALRMEPVFMALGQAGGAAAHLAIERGVAPSRIAMGELQHLLVSGGAVLAFYNDLPFDHADFAPMQYLGARGIVPGYAATPRMKLTRKDGWIKLARVLKSEGREWTPPADSPEAPLQAPDVKAWLREAGYKAVGAAGAEDSQISLAQFARLVYEGLTGPRA